MIERRYATAIDRLSSREGADSDALVQNLLSLLKESGRMKLLPGILRELKNMEARRAILAPSLEIAREEDRRDALAALKAQGIPEGTITLNPSLVSGWRLRSGSTLIDQSAKNQLVELYRNIVTH